jgi:hypothetical protein
MSGKGSGKRRKGSLPSEAVVQMDIARVNLLCAQGLPLNRLSSIDSAPSANSGVQLRMAH